MREFALPRSDEPFDFHRQARDYARWRRDYSAELYAEVLRRVPTPERGDMPLAVDLGCGTGLVARSLRARGFRVVGVDFSAAMLAEARAAGGDPPTIAWVRARAEGLPLCAAQASLLTCGTAFHWLAPALTLAEIERVLSPGAVVALFWRYAAPGEPSSRLMRDVLARFVPALPELENLRVHPPDPFQGSRLERLAERVIESELDFTPRSFHGYVGTLEFVRRVAADRHAEFLAALREELERRWPAGLRERNLEYLFLARRPAESRAT